MEVEIKELNQFLVGFELEGAGFAGIDACSMRVTSKALTSNGVVVSTE